MDHDKVSGDPYRGMSKHRITIEMLNKCKATLICPRITRLIGRNLTILVYHRVSEYKQSCPFDHNLISASPEAFEEQVKYLKANYDCMDFGTLSEILKGDLKFRGNALIITFDDGYRDNYDNAYPILKAHGIPATIFIATQFIDKRSLFWWDRVAYTVKQFRGDSFNINGYRFELGLSSREDIINEILVILKNLDDCERQNMIEQLEQKLDVSIPQRMAETLLLTWRQICEMSEHGIEIGAHTVSHPVLHKVSQEQLIYELRESKRRIEEEIGKKVIAFSYPVNSHGGKDQVKKAVRDSGYSFATTLTHGTNKLGAMNPHSLRRLTVELSHDLDGFRAKLSFPQIIKY